MTDLTPRYAVHVDEARGEIHFETSGLFDMATMDAFLAETNAKAGPLLAKGQKLRSLGDLSNYATQTPEIGAKMADTLQRAEEFGIEKTAIIITSTLLKMQYSRVSEGRNVSIFDNKSDAIAWLRS